MSGGNERRRWQAHCLRACVNGGYLFQFYNRVSSNHHTQPPNSQSHGFSTYNVEIGQVNKLVISHLILRIAKVSPYFLPQFILHVLVFCQYMYNMRERVRRCVRCRKNQRPLWVKLSGSDIVSILGETYESCASSSSSPSWSDLSATVLAFTKVFRSP